MANAYPSSLGQVKAGSDVIPQSGTRIDRASNGDVRGQILYSALRQVFKVIHYLTAAQKTTLDTFYTTNAALEITFTWAIDSAAYNCIFMDAPKYTHITTTLSRVEVMLAQKDV